MALSIHTMRNTWFAMLHLDYMKGEKLQHKLKHHGVEQIYVNSIISNLYPIKAVI